jgi:ABC-type amino acid transport substrate-binding protein
MRYLGLSALSLALLVLALRAYFMVFVPESPPREEVLANIRLMEERVDARVFADVPEVINTELPGSRFDHILDSGVLQVGYRPNNLPCSFLTPEGKLVGFDVEMAHILAEDLGVSLEFTPFEFARLNAMLKSGQIDMAMSCIASLPDRYALASFSRSYLDLTLAFIVPDHERHLFADLEQLRQEENLTIALVSSHYFAPRIRSLLPDARVVTLESAEDFFAGDGQGAHALLLSAEEGAAYSYRYPHYTMVPARRGGIRLPASYAVPKGDIEMQGFVSNWIDLKQKEGTVEQLHNYWMLGGVAKPREPRWSIIRNVLGWVD